MVPTLQTTDRGYLFGPSARGKSALETKKSSRDCSATEGKGDFWQCCWVLEDFLGWKTVWWVSNFIEGTDEWWNECTPYCDYEEIHELTKKPTKALQHTDIVEHFKFAMEHGDRRNGEFTLMKCNKDTCTGCHYCSSHPPSTKVATV